VYRALRPRWKKRQLLWECHSFNLDPEKLIGTLGDTQWARLIGRLDSMWRP